MSKITVFSYFAIIHEVDVSNNSHIMLWKTRYVEQLGLEVLLDE